MELTKTIKRLERLRTDIKSELVSKEWNLDNESKVQKKLLTSRIKLFIHIKYIEEMNN